MRIFKGFWEFYSKKDKIRGFLINPDMIPIAKPLIGEEEKKAVLEVLGSGVIAQGKRVEEFETAFAKYCGTKYAVAVSNGTAGLQLAMMAAGVKQGDEVITSPFSFIATANAILFCGAKPVFADIEEKTFNLDPESVKEKITKKTTAIMPVHLYGQPCDMKAFAEIAEDKGLLIIEDACQAHGAEFDGKKVGSLGNAGVFSFYPTKNMTTGEGGMITTDDAKIVEMARIYRNHGQVKRYHHDYIGYNFRMTDIAAAIGIEQLKKLDGFNKKRIENAKYLDSKLGKVGVTTPFVAKNVKHVYHQYTISVDNRDELNKKLNDSGVGTGIYYPIPINEQTAYKSLGYKADTPISSEVAKRVLSLPVHPAVSKQDLDFTVEKIKESI